VLLEVRADTYLWAIRMYKSRSLAADAIKGGKVKLNNENVKPSHLVKSGEVYSFSIGTVKRVIEVISLIDRRLGFEFAKQHYNDLSPPQESAEKQPSAFYSQVRRSKGSGRPTKKDRRDQEGLF
jgi:ribosome-associated heat shock protein Hsp15